MVSNLQNKTFHRVLKALEKNIGNITLVIGAILALIFQPALITAYVLGVSIGWCLVVTIHAYFREINPLVRVYKFSFFAFIGIFAMIGFTLMRVYLLFDFNWLMAAVAAILSGITLINMLIGDYRQQIEDLEKESQKHEQR